MRKIVAIIGMPGTGKSTLMREWMKQQEWQPIKFRDLVYGHHNKTDTISIVGKYEEGEVFPGTDKLSMAVMPEVKQWLVDEPNRNVIFEGDRLTSMNFLEYCAELKNTQLHIIALTVPKEVMEERYKERGSDQSETFISGRRTKIGNITGNFLLQDYTETFQNTNLDDQKKIINRLNAILEVK